MTPDSFTAAQAPTDPLEFKIEKILVPLDFSPASIEALDYAVEVAKPFRAAIHLIHVHPPDEASSVAGAGHLLLQSAEMIERLNEELTGSRLSRGGRRLIREGLHAQAYRLEDGDATAQSVAG